MSCRSRTRPLRRAAARTLLDALTAAIAGISRERAESFGAWAGGALPYFWPHETRRSIENLERVCGPLPEALRREIPGILGRRLGRNLALSLQGLAPGGAAEGLAVSVQGREVLADACAGGRGAVLISAHCGPWEALPAAIVGAGFRAGLVVRPLRDPALDTRVRALRERGGVRLFQRGTDSAAEMVRWVRQGGVLGIVLDQAPRGRRVDSTWWGLPARTAAGPAWLAARAGVPLCVATVSTQTRPTGSSVAALRIDGPVPVQGTRAPDLRRATRQVARMLDAHLRHSPMDWVWFHDRLGGAD